LLIHSAVQQTSVATDRDSRHTRNCRSMILRLAYRRAVKWNWPEC